MIKLTNFTDHNKNTLKYNDDQIQISGVISMQVYYSIEKYSNEYNIPKHIAYNISFLETKYRGPFHWGYNPHLVSPAGALGPMQVMLSTANIVNGTKTTREKLLHNIDFNIETSMKLLRRLHNKYKNWELVCGAYHTGIPHSNWYAKYCVNNKDYNKNWVFPVIH